MNTWWKVVPLCERQLRDVDPRDVISGGHFRLCNTYKSGGGYDEFPAICERRIGKPLYDGQYSWQFVVQLYGCPLACPYCYVTPDGVWGQPVEYSSYQLVNTFNYYGASVFHLMGGAPAIYMEQWPDLLKTLDKHCTKTQWMFHSDLLLTEGWYDPELLEKITHARALYAVSVKGVAPLAYERNTGRIFQAAKFWHNLRLLEQFRVPYYVTFTGCAEAEVESFWTQFQREFPASYEAQKRDAFSIQLVQYDALK